MCSRYIPCRAMALLLQCLQVGDKVGDILIRHVRRQTLGGHYANFALATTLDPCGDIFVADRSAIGKFAAIVDAVWQSGAARVKQAGQAWAD